MTHLSDESELERTLMVMYENSMRASRLSNEHLVLEVFDAFANEDLQSWRDALLNELVTRFQTMAHGCTTLLSDRVFPEA